MCTYSIIFGDKRLYQLERKPPYLNLYLGGVWVNSWQWYLFLVMAAFDGIAGWKWRQVKGRTL